MIKFPYETRYSENLGKIVTPLIPVTIIGKKEKINLLMLLDSGADISLIPYSVGEFLGLPLNMTNRSEVQGIGEGAVPYILNSVKLKIGDFEFDARIGWTLIEEIPFILGRLDVFQQFSIEFREFENEIILKHSQK